MPGLLPVQPFQETLRASMCGPASLKMVLAYYGVEHTEQELAELCRTDFDLGTSAEALEKAAESLGFTVEIKNNSSFEDIQSWLDRKVPVIVNWFTRGRTDYPESAVPDGHLSVVVGLDDHYIYLQDPEIGNLRQLARDDFMKVWFDFPGNYITTGDDMIIRQLIAIYK
jgi:ABC-type bacteriocin/lantibiotic exporter with double-glycine peptidase domain